LAGVVVSQVPLSIKPCPVGAAALPPTPAAGPGSGCVAGAAAGAFNPTVSGKPDGGVSGFRTSAGLAGSELVENSEAVLLIVPAAPARSLALTPLAECGTRDPRPLRGRAAGRRHGGRRLGGALASTHPADSCHRDPAGGLAVRTEGCIRQDGRRDRHEVAQRTGDPDGRRLLSVYQDADDRVWTRIAGVVIGLSYVALVIAASRRLTRPAALPA
jgi:hypothetical protein